MLMDEFQECQEICTRLMDANKDKDLASVVSHAYAYDHVADDDWMLISMNIYYF